MSIDYNPPSQKAVIIACRNKFDFSFQIPKSAVNMTAIVQKWVPYSQWYLSVLELWKKEVGGLNSIGTRFEAPSSSAEGARIEAPRGVGCGEALCNQLLFS